MNKLKAKLRKANVISQSKDIQSSETIENNNLNLKRILPYGLLLSAICISLIRYVTIAPPIIEDIEEVEIDDIDNTTDNTQDEVLEDEIAETLDKMEESDEEDEEVTSVLDHSEGLITFNKGDTLASVLGRVGINKGDIQNVATAVSRVFPLRKIKPGQQILVKTQDDDKTALKLLEIKPTERYKVVVEKQNNHFIAKKVMIPLKRSVKNVSGVIYPKSPKFSLQHCGLKNKVADDALNALGQVTNIHTAKSKVNFDLVYEQYCTETGKVLDTNLLAMVASVDGKIKKVYKFSVDGSMQYIDADGTVLSTKRSSKMFIQPIPYKKITSCFGYRIHPISGRRKMHTGVDLATSIGTPIRATASGHVVMACHYSGYGKYIRIKHSGCYSTAYAHLSRIVVRPGQYVAQGQVIGYTGNSGYATGSHLHYELMQNGKFINPLIFVPKPLQKLMGKQLVRFNAFKKSIKLKNLPAVSNQI